MTTRFKMFGLETTLRKIPISNLTNTLMLYVFMNLCNYVFMNSNILINLLGNIMLSGLQDYAKELWRF